MTRIRRIRPLPKGAERGKSKGGYIKKGKPGLFAEKEDLQSGLFEGLYQGKERTLGRW